MQGAPNQGAPRSAVASAISRDRSDLGGASGDYGAGIAVDTAGNAYVVGTTQSPDFPTTSGTFDRTPADQFNLRKGLSFGISRRRRLRWSPLTNEGDER